MKLKKNVIIVAGGKGERMNTNVPKQFLALDGKPVLMHTLEKFRQYSPDIQLVLVLPANQMEFWEKLCKNHTFTLQHKVVAGGNARFFSVKNGLDSVVDSDLIAIHDGVRPLVDIETISRCFDEAEKTGAAIPVVDLVDSIRQLSESKSIAVDRRNYKLVQTPQVFKSEIIRKSYQQPYSELFTDDASVVETAGYTVNLVEGNRENIKITTPFDLKMAELFIAETEK